MFFYLFFPRFCLRTGYIAWSMAIFLPISLSHFLYINWCLPLRLHLTSKEVWGVSFLFHFFFVSFLPFENSHYPIRRYSFSFCFSLILFPYVDFVVSAFFSVFLGQLPSS